MADILVALLVGAAFWLLNSSGYSVLAWVAIALGVVFWWSASIMHNQASRAPNARRLFRTTIMRNLGASEREIEIATREFRQEELRFVSDRVTFINMLSVIGLVVLLVLAVVLRVWF